MIYIYKLSYNVHLCEASRNISVTCCSHPLSFNHPQPFHHNFFNFALFHGTVMVRINFHPSSCCHLSSSFLMISAGVRSNSLAIKRCLGVTRNSRQGRPHDDPHAGHKIRVGSLQHGGFLGEKPVEAEDLKSSLCVGCIHERYTDFFLHEMICSAVKKRPCLRVKIRHFLVMHSLQKTTWKLCGS